MNVVDDGDLESARVTAADDFEDLGKDEDAVQLRQRRGGGDGSSGNGSSRRGAKAAAAGVAASGDKKGR